MSTLLSRSQQPQAARHLHRYPSVIKVTVVATIAGMLAACGGGGGGGGPSSNTTRISGLVVDGYIGGATVCLDTNFNNQCDTSEPKATTNAQGQYALEVSAADAKRAPILVQVDVGNTDSDAPGGKVAQAYNMATPAGQTTVTPITTLVHAETLEVVGGSAVGLKNLTDEERSAAFATAQANVKTQLGFAATDNIMADPVAVQVDQPKLRNLALAAANLLQAGHGKTDSATPSSQRLAVALQLVSDHLPAISAHPSIAQANAVTQDGAVKTLLTQAVSNINNLSAENIQAALTIQRRNETLAERIVTRNILDDWRDGRFTFEVSQSASTNTSFSVKSSEERIVASGMSPLYVNRNLGLTGETPQWQRSEPSPFSRMHYWTFASGQWQKFESFSGRVYSDAGNGYYDETAPQGDSRLKLRVNRYAHNLAGLKMSAVTASNQVAANMFKDGDVFPEGSVAYSFGPRVLLQERLEALDDTTALSINNQVITDANGQRVNSYAGVVAAFADTGTRGLGYGSGTGCLYFGSGTNSGKLYYRARTTDNKCPGVGTPAPTGSTFKPYDGTWEIVNRMEQPVLKLNTSAVPIPVQDNILVLVNGGVRYGTYYYANAVWNFGGTATYFNRAAVNAMLSKIPNASSLPTASDSPLFNTNGTWTGTATLNDGTTRKITAKLTQGTNDTHAKGTITFADAQNNVLAQNGVLLGVVNDRTLAYRLAFAPGNLTNKPTCQSVLTGYFGQATVVNGSVQITGRFDGSERCGSSASTNLNSSNVVLTRQ